MTHNSATAGPSLNEYVDAHCHLERAVFGDELGLVLERAWAAGVCHIVAVGASNVLAGAHEALALAEEHDRISVALAIHPHEAHLATDSALEEIERLIVHPKVVALGEIGLDFHYDFAPKDVQRRVFSRELVLARQYNVPVMIHEREAHADCVRLCDEVGLPAKGGVVHCFSAGVAEAEAYVARGLYLSIPGIITFKKAEALCRAVQATPLERLLVETDAPYLAPVPHRGKRNEPAFVTATAAAIARVKNVPLDLTVRQLRHNAERLFGIACTPCAVAQSPVGRDAQRAETT